MYDDTVDERQLEWAYLQARMIIAEYEFYNPEEALSYDDDE